MIASWHGDLGSANVAALAEEIWARFGPVELLVNNVGINTPHGYLDLTERDFDFVFRTNCRGPCFFTQRIVAELTAEGHRGAIVFISSLHDHIVHRRPHYSASKAAVAMLVRELAHELGPSGIRVNAISPGLVQSDSVPPPHPAEEPRIRQLIPLGRIGQPEDVAALAAVLLSEECSGYVTGVNVAVDGGLGLYSWSQDK
jgi:NAD(P)-dependent dehydrogenase (short-subunit alcohol dehydrogenase family)